MEFQEFEGKSTEEAIENACAHFQVSPEQLEIEILSVGSPGIFGLGGRKAKIRAALQEESEENLITAARELLENARRELRSEGVPVPERAGGLTRMVLAISVALILILGVAPESAVQLARVGLPYLQARPAAIRGAAGSSGRVGVTPSDGGGGPATVGLANGVPHTFTVTAGGAIAAMKAAGIQPLPPVTGQDAELAAIQRILAGEQYMTVYKAIKPEANAAAELAYALCQGKRPDESKVNGQIDNGKRVVPSILLAPVSVTRNNLMLTVVADHFWSVDQICTADFEAFCDAAGIK